MTNDFKDGEDTEDEFPTIDINPCPITPRESVATEQKH